MPVALNELGLRHGIGRIGDCRHRAAPDRRVLRVCGLCRDARRPDVVFHRPGHCRHRPQEADRCRDGANRLAVGRGHADPGRRRAADAAAGPGRMGLRRVEPGAGGLPFLRRAALLRCGRPARSARPAPVHQRVRGLHRSDRVRAVGCADGQAGAMAGRALAAAGDCRGSRSRPMWRTRSGCWPRRRHPARRRCSVWQTTMVRCPIHC